MLGGTLDDIHVLRICTHRVSACADIKEQFHIHVHVAIRCSIRNMIIIIKNDVYDYCINNKHMNTENVHMCLVSSSYVQPSFVYDMNDSVIITCTYYRLIEFELRMYTK